MDVFAVMKSHGYPFEVLGVCGSVPGVALAGPRFTPGYLRGALRAPRVEMEIHGTRRGGVGA